MMIDILIALGVVAAIALLMGILLALVTHFFGIEESKKLKQIRACLPGVNCGACGYKGCDDYASALEQGTAKPNLCVPGGEDTSSEIGALLGIEVEAAKSIVAFVHCNGNCTATTKKAAYNGISTCKAASMLYGGPDACRHGCMGYGDCASVCPAEAICVKDGIAHIDPTRCIGCGLCADTCPKKVISMIPKEKGMDSETQTVVMCNNKDKGADARKACKNACIGCKKCEKTCPNGAIKVENNVAVIHYEKCTNCGACVAGCPMGCLKNI